MKTFLSSSKVLLFTVALLIFIIQTNAQQNRIAGLADAPVYLLGFSAKTEAGTIEVKWSAKMDKRFSHFIVEQSFDGKEYGDHALFFGAENPVGTENFSFKDKNIKSAASIIYYRLKMAASSGKISYSPVCVVHLK